MVRDPVCGMTIDPKKAQGSVIYQGVEYFFCSAGCLHAFQKEPEKYIAVAEHPHEH